MLPERLQALSADVGLCDHEHRHAHFTIEKP